MACVIIPAAEAVITTILAKAVKSKEEQACANMSGSESTSQHINFSRKLGWLNKMLWGGTALLAFEHVWHGEVTPVFPFLTGESSGILAEMATTGVTMSAVVTATWLVMLAAAAVIEKRPAREAELVENTAQI